MQFCACAGAPLGVAWPADAALLTTPIQTNHTQWLNLTLTLLCNSRVDTKVYRHSTGRLGICIDCNRRMFRAYMHAQHMDNVLDLMLDRKDAQQEYQHSALDAR